MGGMKWATPINKAVELFDEDDERRAWERLSIYRVPHYMKIDDPNGTAYKPLMVSIGPYHFGEEHLMPMEEYKYRALTQFLRNTNKTLGDYMSSLRDILPELMDSYEELDDRWRKEQDEFLRLLVIDGCFVIEVIRNHFNKYTFINTEYIKRDMLLIENQLPVLVLENLMAVFTAATGVQIDMNNLLLNFCFLGKGATCTGRGNHMLDVVRQSMIQSLNVDQPTHGLIGPCQFGQCTKEMCLAGEKEYTRTMINNQSATVLHQVGIKFIRNATHRLNDIRFKNGNLHLPTITIEQNSESMFLNIIAFEQLHWNASYFMSSYFLFLSGLITSADDVRLLRDREIIESSVACDDTIQEIFMKLAKGLSFGKDDDLCHLQQELNGYYLVSKDVCKRKRDRWYLKPRDTYFESHWSIIKMVAGIFIVVAIVAGACYQVLSYYKASH